VRCGISIWPVTAMGQERRIGAVRNISALPTRADVGADIVELPVSVTEVYEVNEPNVPGCDICSAANCGLFDHLAGELLKL
jgi:hypothetical protein